MLSDTQLYCATSKTRTGRRSMKNNKPYRSPQLKADAKAECFKTEGGYYRSYVKRQFHPS